MATPTLFFTLFSLSAIYIATAETQSFNLQSNSSCLPSPSSQFALSVGRRIIATGNVTITWTANRDDKPIASGEILLSNYANSKITWWSFDFPTNKIVSVQRLDNNIMTLHFYENNHSIGRFQIIIKDDESAVLHRTVNINTSVDFYWSLQTSMRGRNISLKIDDDGNLHLNNSAGFNRTNQSAAGEWSGTVNICQNKIEVDKVSQSNSTDRAKKTQASKNVLVVGIVLIITSIAFLLASSGYLISRRRIVMHVKNPVNSSAPTFIEEMNLRRFSYGELVKFTENFKEELGRGSFGKVYKGLLPNGDKRNIAVKKLELIGEEREREFEAEMKTIGRTHHRNLVRLVGFCNQGSNRLLVYEFMSNGSLADLLFKAQTCLNWNKRMKIALDVAKGIYYLHEECDTHIIHCDIKPQNILMDKGGTAKISDFGLAKLLLSDQTKTSTGIRGTRGYVAPEWFKRAPITMKADVFSFGVVLLELACRRRHVELEAAENEIILLDWVYDCLERGELHKLAPDQEIEKATLERMVRVGLWCTIDDPASRPTMKKVILMLEGIVNTPTPPSPFSSYTYSKNHTLQN